ncbi:MAG: ABC transporter ATP-binding protein [Erythrobacter sp.]|jgi:ATP-binding cassette subfamily B protein/subfamily B ATP-binding cassette protein MsbA|nr:ABC transporter ATP-binding protein [Erythrobacter sp.]
MDILLRWARPHRNRLITIGLISIVSSVAVLAVPWLAAQFIRQVVGAEQGMEPAIDGVLPLLVATLIVLAAVTVLVAILTEDASGKILADLKCEVFAHVLRLPPSFHDEARDGDLLSLMTSEVTGLSTFLTATIAQIPAMIVTALGACILLLYLDPILALLAPALIPVFFVGLKLTGRRLRELARSKREAEVAVVTRAYVGLEMIEAVKAFAVEQRHAADYRDAAEHARRLAFAQTRLSAFIGPVSALLAALGAIAILALGSGPLAARQHDAGDLFALLLYAALLTRPLGNLATAYSRFQIARGALAKLQALFETAPEPGLCTGRRIDRASGAITFEKVSFGYPGRPQILDAVDLEIASGEIVALTGENGIGKSTLVRLMLRFYEPVGGRILLDGQDIRSLQIQDLRRQFGYVPQRALLFDGTVLENIAFGMSDPDPAALERAARMAQAWDFIERLPEGMATQIGDYGVRLSGGQRQRIALARALLCDPAIYILDEATSMYDLESEAAFVDSCIEALKDRTVILITHRPASLALAHRIIHAADLGNAGHRAGRTETRLKRAPGDSS